MTAALVVAVYAVGGAVFGPHLVESKVRRHLAASGELSLTVARTRFDPFTLSAEFEDVIVSANAFEPIRAERIRAAFDPFALWGPGLNLRALHLERPGGSISWSPAMLSGLSRWAAAAVSGAHPLRVGRLEIHDGSVRIEPSGDRAPRLELDRISLIADERLIAEADHSLGGRLEVAARAQLDPLAAEGSFAIVADDPARLLGWLGLDRVQAAGELTLGGEFSAGLDPDPRLRLTGLALGGDRLELALGPDALRLDRLRVSDVDVDPARRTVRVGELSADGGSLTLAGPVEAGVAAGGWLAAASTWTVAVARLETRALAVELDPSPTGARWRFEPIELRLDGFDSASASPAAFSLEAGINQSGRLSAEGRLWGATRELAADVTLADLDLAALSPHLGPAPGLALTRGRGAAEGTLRYRSGALGVSGQASVHELALAEPGAGEPLFTATAAALSGIEFDAGAGEPSIERVRLEGPVLSLRLGHDGELEPGGWSELHRAATTAIRRLEIAGGTVAVTDARPTPPVELRATGLAGAADGLGGTGAVTLELAGTLNGSAGARLVARRRGGSSLLPWDVDLLIGELDRALLDPYAARFLGRRVEAGSMSLALHYHIAGRRLVGRHHAVIEGLQLGGADAAAPGRLDLAQALLQDPHGRIDVTIPVAARLDDPKLDFGASVAAAVEGFLADLEANPFRALGELVGVPARDVAAIEFAPGSAALTPPARTRLDALANALLARPGLGLRIAGGWADEADGRALARRQLNLHVALATGAAPPGSADPGPPAFADPKVHSVLDEFAGERLAADQRTAIEDRHAGGDRAGYYRALFEALVAGEPIAEATLRKLARYRAQAVVAELAALGLPATRLRVTEPEPVTAAAAVPVRLALEVGPSATSAAAAGGR